MTQNHLYKKTPHSNFTIVFVLALWLVAGSCDYHYAAANRKAYQVRVMDAAPDSAVAVLIDPYRMAIEGEMNMVVAELAVDLRKGKPESPLGNFICDVIVTQGEIETGKKIDFGVYNYGGIRQDILSAGPITKGKIYELLPFENFGAIVTLDGPATFALIQKIIAEEGWPVSRGLKIVVKNNLPETVLINNVPLDTAKSYTVVMNDYMAGGGDNSTFLKGQQVDILGITIRDMMLDYLHAATDAGNKISAKNEGRIVYAD